MSTLFPKTISFKRRTGVFTDGVYVTNETDSSFVGSVQPLTGKEIETFVAGRADKGHVKVYSATRLNVCAEGQLNSGDVVIWQSQKWEVIYEMINQNDLIEHYKYIAEYRGNL